MSYSFDEDVAFHKKWLVFLQEGREKYPDLHQEQFPARGKLVPVYVSKRVASEATDVDFQATADGKEVVAHVYVNFNEGRVYADSLTFPPAYSVMKRLKEKNPDAYRALVECVLEEM